MRFSSNGPSGRLAVRALRLVLAVSLGLALGSAPALAASEAVRLTLWHYWDGANGQALEKLVKDFEKAHPNIDIEPLFVPGSELLTKLRTALASRQTPDLAVQDLVNMPLLVRSGALVPLDTYIATSNAVKLDDFFPAPLTYGRYNGHLYSLPVSSSNLALFWNKQLFAQAGLDSERPPRNWDELAAFGRQIRQRTGKWGLELFTQGGEGTTWQWQVYLWSAGGEFLSPDNREPAFQSEAGVRALRFWVDLIHDHKISPLAPWGLFGRGEAAMVMDGSWMTEFFPMQVDFELGAAPFPAAPGGSFATNLGGEQMFVFRSTPEHEKAAWEFIEWFASTPVQVEWDRLTGFIPVRRSVAGNPAYRAWVANSRPLLKPFVEVQAYAHARPAVTRYAQVSDIVANHVVEALYKRVTPEQALTEAAAEVRPLLQEP
ncbi:ABC transporter substrate-binding protein [Carboxydochorda subterranea]|uniref:ABC transporter substrate-binding protein n=1 Tax=Carboxydichorda subterranea TaxID=3109565 RepID=A0ABZ1BU54_9FIRM|nr:ABC transporter substrate-binding protein [Limnochorda sp. L945t]WRP16051.1 ABC transporter substrate-binding protein [Limnochorda sp. L945t]